MIFFRKKTSLPTGYLMAKVTMDISGDEHYYRRYLGLAKG